MAKVLTVGELKKALEGVPMEEVLFQNCGESTFKEG